MANFQHIINGEMKIVYSSPKAMLSNNQWREVICSSIYQQSVIAVAVDEAYW